MNHACKTLRDSLRFSAETAKPFSTEDAHHMQTCVPCQSHAAMLASLPGLLRSQDHSLGSFKQKMMLSRMSSELDAISSGYASGTRPHSALRRPLAGAFALAVALCVVLWSQGLVSRDDSQKVASMPSQPASDSALATSPGAPSKTDPTTEEVMPAQHSLLTAVLLSGAQASDPTNLARLGVSVATWHVDTGSQLRAQLPEGLLVLTGPAQLVATRSETGLTLTLSQGHLLASLVAGADERVFIQLPERQLRLQQASFAADVSTGTTTVANLAGTLWLRDDQGEIQPLALGMEMRGNITETLSAMRATNFSKLLRVSSARNALGSESQRQLDLGRLAPGLEVTVGGSYLGTTPLIALVGKEDAIRIEPSAVDAAASHPRAPTPDGHRPKANQLDAVSENALEEVSAPSADALYLAAEQALRDGTADQARADWLTLVQQYPDDPLAGLALYDLARLARKRGRIQEAQDYVARLAGKPVEASLLESAAWLGCQLHKDASDSEYISCLRNFSQRFPSSPHRVEIESLLDGQ